MTEYKESLSKSIAFLNDEMKRLKTALSDTKADSKEHSRILKDFVAVEKRYFMRCSELEKLEITEPKW